jgi:hypothetical protein
VPCHSVYDGGGLTLTVSATHYVCWPPPSGGGGLPTFPFLGHNVWPPIFDWMLRIVATQMWPEKGKGGEIGGTAYTIDPGGQ